MKMCSVRKINMSYFPLWDYPMLWFWLLFNMSLKILAHIVNSQIFEDILSIAQKPYTLHVFSFVYMYNIPFQVNVLTAPAIMPSDSEWCFVSSIFCLVLVIFIPSFNIVFACFIYSSLYPIFFSTQFVLFFSKQKYLVGIYIC